MQDTFHSAKRVMASLAIAVLLLVLSGCSNRDSTGTTSFHPLPDLAFVSTGQDHHGKSYSVRNDFVVITNPPADHKKLQALVDAYNQKTLPEEQLARQLAYIRRFYQESARMPRNYKESDQGYFSSDRVEDHGDDLLLVVKWEAFGKERSDEFP